MANFTRIRTIASGRRSEIVLAHDLEVSAGSPREVVLKRLPGARRAIDAALQQHLVGMNVAGVHSVRHLGITSFEGEPAIVMPYVRGVHLGELLAFHQRHRMTLGKTLIDFIIRRVAFGLHEVHRAFTNVGATVGGSHGDVSPENVLLSIYGEVKITDYASVHLVRPSDVHERNGSRLVIEAGASASFDERAVAALAVRLGAVDADISAPLVDRFVDDATNLSSTALKRLEATLSEGLFDVAIRTLSGRTRSGAPFASFTAALDGEAWDLGGALTRRLGERVADASAAKTEACDDNVATEPVRMVADACDFEIAHAVVGAAAAASRLPTGRIVYEAGASETEADLVEIQATLTVPGAEGFRALLAAINTRVTGLWVWSNGDRGGEVYLADGVPKSLRFDVEPSNADGLLREATCRERWLALTCQTEGEFALYENIDVVLGHSAFIDTPLRLVEEAVRHRIRIGLETTCATLEHAFALRLRTQRMPWLIEEYGSIAYDRIIDSIAREPSEPERAGERSSGVAIHASAELVILHLMGVIEPQHADGRVFFRSQTR